MKAKALELRDEGTFIPLLAVDINPENEYQRWLMRRVGYPCNGEPNVIITRLEGTGSASNDPYSWGGRTFPAAHNWIIEHWDELEDGDVVDVSFILGETKTPKISERGPVEIKCPHGEVLGECDACDAAGDFAFDAVREDRIFGR